MAGQASQIRRTLSRGRRTLLGLGLGLGLRRIGLSKTTVAARRTKADPQKAAEICLAQGKSSFQKSHLDATGQISCF